MFTKMTSEIFTKRQKMFFAGMNSPPYVYFVQYDVTVSFLAQVFNTVTFFVSQVLVVDTVTYFGGNHGSRV